MSMRWWVVALVAAVPVRAMADPGGFIDDDQMAAYQNEKGCTGPAFDKIKAVIADDARGYQIDQMNPDVLDPLKEGQGEAIDQNALAQAAADKGCTKLAHTLFLGVIEKFTGDGYAAMRQRAQIGLDDLRAK